MRKKLLMLSAALACCGLLRAQSATMSLVVEMRDGTQSAFRLSEKPEMRFDGADCVFTSTEVEVRVAKKDFDHFHFKSITTPVEESPSARGVEAELVAPGVLRVCGVEAGGVRVFALDGSACRADVSVQGDAVTVSVSHLPQGVYVVRYGATAVKIANN